MLDALWAWRGALAAGAVTTLEISAGAFLVAVLLGLATASAQLWGGRALRDAARAYVLACRAIPELLLIIVLYYAGSAALGRLLGGRVEISAFAAAIVVLGIVQGAYAGEVIRSAIQAIPAGQIEAGRAYAFSPFALLRRIVVPLTLPTALPGLGNLWVVLIKESSLISVVGFGELMAAAKVAGGSTRFYFTFYCAAGLIYLAIALVSGALLGRIERRYRVGRPAQ